MGSNFLTSSQVGCFAAPEWVLTFNLPKNYFDLKPQAIQQQRKWLQESDKTSRRSPRLRSTSRSTWSSTPATCTCPCTPTSTGTTWLTRAWRLSSRSPQKKRGGKVVFQDIAKPSSMEWGSPVDALEAALELEKTVNQSLLDMHKASDGDAHLCDFIEGEFLGEQVDAIKEISGWITKMKRAGPGIGFHLIDKEIGN